MFACHRREQTRSITTIVTTVPAAVRGSHRKANVRSPLTYLLMAAERPHRESYFEPERLANRGRIAQPELRAPLNGSAAHPRSALLR
jgi:hypothetical protein